MTRSTSVACAVTAAITMGASLSVGALHIGDEQHRTVNELRVIQGVAPSDGGLPDSVLGALSSTLVLGPCTGLPEGGRRARNRRGASR